ncbi:MAG: helix-turn-helix domain-containing protein [Prevotella sp.]|nr:helix-turn-helix domain-containing protein [Bacteroides sp.]MCM1366858.1 helix-turn-helix domain-containing protein [Prevotella sp.]MCM1437416.1 helix-turn-helix domain-containing protein [Prevotella sp.]
MTNPATIVTLSDLASVLRKGDTNHEILVYDSGSLPPAKNLFPVRVDALTIQLCLSGHANITIDMMDYELIPGDILVLQPNNYVNNITFNSDFHSHIIACSTDMVKDVLPKLTDLLPLLIHHRAAPVTNLSPDEAEEFDKYFNIIHDSLQKPYTLFQKQKIRCILQAALFELMDIKSEDGENIISKKSRKEEIMAQFLINISKHFREQRQVSFYAKKLFITPKHLSTVVKSLTNKTAGEWIENFVIMEAKVMLKTTDLPIQQIAQRLNFANQSFFGKYFKHITGLSPSEFRHNS